MIRFGVSGDRGSFSEEAALQYGKEKHINMSLIYLIDMEGVLQALEHGKVNMGILPVVNLTGGLVQPALEAMGRHAFKLIDSFWLEVNQCLLGAKGAQLSEITHIASHPQGLLQCKEYLAKTISQASLIEWCDTAQAALALAQGIMPKHTAVIAPERCKNLYGLDLIAKNIQDTTPNLTAFIVVENIVKTQKQASTPTTQLEQVRSEIERIDAEIIKHLAKRDDLAKQIGQLKTAKGCDVIDLFREQKLFEFYQQLSEKHQLSGSFIKQLFQLIIDHSRQIQKL
jgi:prephenate dehydratase